MLAGISGQLLHRLQVMQNKVPFTHTLTTFFTVRVLLQGTA